MTCILLRHGQSKANVGETEYFDSDITERGKYQIEEAALHVKDIMGLTWPDLSHEFVGFVSPYLRALRTAFVLHRRWDIPFIVDYRIGETPVGQVLEDSHLASRYKEYPSYQWERFPENGVEQKDCTLDGYYNHLKEFAKELPEDSIIVSHMTTIKVLTEILIGSHLTDRDISNASITLIEDGRLMFMGKR